MYHIKIEGMHGDEEWVRVFNIDAPSQVRALQNIFRQLGEKSEEIVYIETHQVKG